MRTLVGKASLVVTLLCVSAGVLPSQAWAQATSPVAPTLIPVSGRLVNADGSPRTGQVSLLISLYNAQNDAAPRWIEQQTVTLDPTGAYSVQFGSTLADGLPADLFATEGGARWLGVTVQAEDPAQNVEQSRVMLVSVPYAAKAAAAETLGGKSASDFVLTSTFREDLRTVLEEEGVASGGDVGAAAVAGGLNYLQKGDGAAGTVNSGLFETGGNLGIGTTTPAYTLDIQRAGNIYNRMRNTANTGTSGFLWENTARSWFAGLGYSALGGAFEIFDVTGSRSRLLIDTAGRVGIGTTTPQTGFMLDVKGNFRGSDSANRGIEFQAGATNYLLAYDRSNSVYLPIELDGSTISLMAGNGLRGLYIDSAGNVGIGTLAPSTKLQVIGNATITGNVTVDGNIAAKYQDVAEWVDSAEPLEAGSLVVIDSTATNRVAASRKAYDGRVAGAVSPQPGLVLGEPAEGRVLVAQSGRVRVKADARFGAIRPGDLLVSSPTQGHVMKSKPVKIGEHVVHRPGTVVGKALEALPKGQGEILVLLTLQ